MINFPHSALLECRGTVTLNNKAIQFDSSTKAESIELTLGNLALKAGDKLSIDFSAMVH